MKIIGLGNRKGVGKDTFAGYLAEDIIINHSSVKVMSFASRLKELSRLLFSQYGLQGEVFYENDRVAKETPLKVINKSPRDIYIEFGQFMRSYDSDYWVNSVLNNLPDVDYVIITDVRFPNEVQRIKALQGHLVNVTRPDVPPTEDSADSALDALGDWWHSRIINDGSLGDLKENAQCLRRLLRYG